MIRAVIPLYYISVSFLSGSPYPPVIGICGDFESGKDEVASILVKHYQYTRVSFADFLRAQIYEYLLSQAGYPSDFPKEIVDIIRSHRNDPYAVYRKPTSLAMRNVLQYIGTDYFRTLDKDYWVKEMAAYAKPLLDAGRRIAIPDMRYPNEVDYVRQHDGDTWRVLRPLPDKLQNEFRKHLSERALDQIEMDHAVVNDGTLPELKNRVDLAIALALDSRTRRRQQAA